MDKLIIYGNGRIARIIYQFLKNHFDVTAFTVDEKLIEENSIEGLPLIPFEDIQEKYSADSYKMLIAVGYIQLNALRAQKYQEAKLKGYSFINYIHPSVELHDSVKLGENNVILDHATIHPYARIGNSNIVWSNAVIAHGCTVENNCWITSGVTVAGDSTVRSNTFLGVNATVGHNITIEEENFIGANCLVSRSTKPKELYGSRDSEKHRLDSQRFMQFTGV